MKKSIVINLYGILRKITYIIMGIVIIFLSFYIRIPQYIIEKMADTVFANENKNTISDIFSLSGETVIKNMMTHKITEKIQSSTPDVNTVSQSSDTQKNQNTPLAPAVDFSSVTPQNAIYNGKIAVSNVPKKAFDITELMSRPLSYEKTDGYKVLIIHTHTTEAYLPNDRSENQNENIVRIGLEFAKVLNQNGIKTLHEKTVHDIPYSKSYINEQKTLERILKENPSIEVVIDVHRDGLYNEKNEKLRPVSRINNKDTAQVMLVCGTDASGLEHKNWESCFSFALKVQDNMVKNYPNLARPINLRTERFNTHMTKNSVIFEIGANGNSLDEAIYASQYAAQAVADVINKK